MSTQTIRFSDLLEMIERLPLDQRESLVDVVRKRMAEEERHRIAASIRSARREHSRGRCKPTTPDELMREILAWITCSCAAPCFFKRDSDPKIERVIKPVPVI